MSDKYELVAAQCADHQTAAVVDAPTITQMCVWLEVSRSGFYEWRERPVSATRLRHEELKIEIQRLFELSDGTYGYRRIHVELLRAGWDVGEEQVRALMRELGLVACQPRPYKATTVAGGESAAPDLVCRVFAADALGTKLVGDITYIHTWEGWLYLATVIDCFNREVVGYAMADHMRAELVVDALDMAARNHNLADECIFHSDRGSQYTSSEFVEALVKYDMRQSLGRTGSCYDNALAESFNGALKVERVHRTAYPTRDAAKEDIARYIEIFYNHRRIHSGIDYRTPHEVRNEYLNRQQAA